MNKKYIIKKNEEIQQIIGDSNKKVNKYFVIYFRKNNYNFNRYCISVSKKIGKANMRNLYKRRIKDILMKNNINFSKDYVIILRVSILNLNYEQIQNELINRLPRERSNKYFPDENDTKDNALFLALNLCLNGNVAIYVKLPKTIKTIIKRLADLNKRNYDTSNFVNTCNLEELSKIANLISKHYGEDHYLVEGIRLGLAGHSSKIENGIKISIEYAFNKNYL